MAHTGGVRTWLQNVGLAIAMCLIAGPIHAQSDNTEKLYQRLLRSTVWVVVPKNKSPGTNRYVVTTGTGSLVDKARRLVLTNFHVVGRDTETVLVAFPVYQNGKTVAVAERSFYQNLLSTGRGIRGKVIAREPKCDLALIQLEKVPEDAWQLPLAPQSPSPGQDVHSVGNPGQSGALWVYTAGKVRQVYHHKWRADAGNDHLDLEAEVVETQSPINRGDSGGPLVNNKGQLVGVTQGHLLNAQDLSLFIDVSEVKKFLKSKNLLPSSTRENRSLASISEPRPAEKPTDEERKAATKLEFAKELAMDGKLERAKSYCEQILQLYPKTKAAAGAKELLEKLSK
jgi:S1-C subfamily serine protease